MCEIESVLNKYKSEFFIFFRRIIENGDRIILKTEILKAYDNFSKQLKDSKEEIFGIIDKIQELTMQYPKLYGAIRTDVGEWKHYAFDIDSLQYTEVKTSAYLDFKEKFVGRHHKETWSLKLDFEPFIRDFPKVPDKQSIGKGIENLNIHLCRSLKNNQKYRKDFLDYLKLHKYEGISFMINERIDSEETLQQAIETLFTDIRSYDDDTPYDSFKDAMTSLGFEAGWGINKKNIIENLQLLQKILLDPEPQDLERFISIIPMIFKVAIISPHGFFGQSNVLGFPDTGGQVVYILDQVRSLEKKMMENIASQGLNIKPQIIVLTRLIPESEGTTCDTRIEKIWGCEHAKILRVPFSDSSGNIIDSWISRFKIWPYLERFAIDAKNELLLEFGSKPDLIIGNYSDGNLVATLLSQQLKVTQCNIAHALEKSKYLFSDLYWRDNEDEYHFSCQFTADLIAMNSADFIITSTYQEIAGNEKSVGQYESYKHFTLPELYQVVNGLDVRDPKFNIISPGANEEIFFPYYNRESRKYLLNEEIENLIYGKPDDKSRGELLNIEKPIIYSIARLDKVKNLTSLVEWYGESKALRSMANLLIVAGYTDTQKSKDQEEIEQIQTMHALFDKYSLDNDCRWLGVQLEKQLSGEIYRFIADKKGVFVQPALFEAFGLTVIEAMSSGLPVFATKYGGPLEIIQDQISGYHIDPTDKERSTKTLVDFFEHNNNDGFALWESISNQALRRVNEEYNWRHYTDRLLALSKVYGFYKHVTNKDREEIRRYLEMFYGLMHRGLVEKSFR